MLRWINRLLGILFLLVVLIVGGVLLLPADRLAMLATDQLRSVTGREIRVEGDVGLTLWPTLGVSVGSLEIANAEWSDQGPMLTAQNAAIGLDAMALVQGNVVIRNIEAASPTIRLEQRADGRASWQFTDASGAAEITTGTAPDRAPQPFVLHRLSVTDATLVYDAEGADLVSYSGVDLVLDWPEPTGAATIDAVIRPTGAPVTVAAIIERFAGFITGQVQRVDVTLSAAGGSARLTGRAATTGAVAGQLRLQTPNTGAFLAALGGGGLDLPLGLGRSADVTAEITLTGDRQLALRGIEATLDGNRISGAADIGLNGTPQVNAQLTAGELDLAGLTGSGDSTGPGGTAGGWPGDRIDAGGLAAFNGDIALRADAIDFGAIRLGATRALVRNDRSRLVFELREAAAYDGTLSGEFVVNNRNGLSVGGKLFAGGIGVQPLLSDLVGIDRLTGSADAELSFLGVGGSVDAIMKSLSGSGAVKLGQGTIRGIDLDALMGQADVSGGTTVFDSLGATFGIEAGVLHNDDLLLVLQNYDARGEGVIDLGRQRIDYLFTPRSLRANQGRGLAIPVRVRGPWADPSILPDIGAAIDLNLAEERKAVEDRVSREIENRIERELGVEIEEGENVEDALQRKLEEEVGNRLRSVFD